MNEFKSFHPTVGFLYFLAVLGFSMVFMNPLALLISLVSGFTYSLILNGKKAFRSNFLYMLPLVLLIAVINPLFNHAGLTILAYLPTNNPLTLESVIYGIAAAVMLWSVICHFSCFNNIMTSDKLLYIFGKIIPSLSLILSMVLRFVPRFKAQLKNILNTQKGLGQASVPQGIIQRVKNGIKILSVMITWCFENSIDTAESMKSRGYGLPKRSVYSNFKLSKQDIAALLYIMPVSAYIIFGAVKKALYFKYFPSISFAELTPFTLSVFITYLMLFILPIIIEVWEVVKWKQLKSKI